jgi:hypothetical protein
VKEEDSDLRASDVVEEETYISPFDVADDGTTVDKSPWDSPLAVQLGI